MYSQKQIIASARHLANKYNTYNPFDIADWLHIQLIRRPLGNVWGFYMYAHRNKQIYLNDDIEDTQQRFACSHELGHAVLHPKENCPFMKADTLFSVDRLEIEANIFAACLMFPVADGELYTPEQVAITLKVTESPAIYEAACGKAIF
jgi:Zn-dependent peptidase ImmA (M78 family)